MDESERDYDKLIRLRAGRAAMDRRIAELEAGNQKAINNHFKEMLEWIFDYNSYNSGAAFLFETEQMEIVRKIEELAKTTLYLLGSNMPDAFTPDHFMKSAPLTEHTRLCILVNYAYNIGQGMVRAVK